MRSLWSTTAGLIAAAVSVPAGAQVPASTAAPLARAQSSRTTVYEAAFFAQYAPRTAYDMVQRVPGFQLDLGATQTATGTVDVRGFAGTAGNVVVLTFSSTDTSATALCCGVSVSTVAIAPAAP